jgi:hypothetical protein
LDFDFHGGGGFVVKTKPFALEIPERYSFHFHVRGFICLDCPAEGVVRF